MAMDFNAAMKLKQAWDTFTGNHPKFPGFLNAMRARGVHEGDIVAISVTGPDGKTMETNIRVTASDLELFETLKNLR